MKLYQGTNLKEDWYSQFLHINKVTAEGRYFDGNIKEVTLIEGIKNRVKSSNFLFIDIKIIRSEDDY